MIEGFFWVWNFRFRDFFGYENPFGKYFLGVAWFFVGTFGGIKKNWYCPGGCIVLQIKYRQTNVFCFCLIVNYGVALHCLCYTMVCIVPWYWAVYKTSTTSIQSVGFTVTEIPLCFSELFISFTCELLRATKSAWDFFGVNFWPFLGVLLGVLLEAPGIFLGLDFWLHLIILVTWNPKYPPWAAITVGHT